MSKAKTARNKRPPPDIEKQELVLPPAKRRAVQPSFADNTCTSIPGELSALQATVPNHVHASHPRISGENRMQDQRAEISRAGMGQSQGFLEEMNISENDHSKSLDETKEQTSQNGRKDKAKSRQAKSERRSKKRGMKHEMAHTVEAVGLKPDEALDDRATDILDPIHFTPDEARQATSTSSSKAESNQRFIVFIGNLPYSATTPAIQSHFSKLHPFTVRHSTDKVTGRSRGFAFLEFEGYDKMKTCLKLFHHSLFESNDDSIPTRTGKENKQKARKINVELTAGGGGGKSAARKEKIREKNEKLEGERERAWAHREKAEAVMDKRKRDTADKSGANAIEVADQVSRNQNVHPSRRKRVES